MVAVMLTWLLEGKDNLFPCLLFIKVMINLEGLTRFELANYITKYVLLIHYTLSALLRHQCTNSFIS